MVYLDIRGTVGRIHKGDYLSNHCYTQNKSFWPHGFRGGFYVFPIVKLWELNTQGVAILDPTNNDWHDLCRVPLNIATYLI